MKTTKSKDDDGAGGSGTSVSSASSTGVGTSNASSSSVTSSSVASSSSSGGGGLGIHDCNPVTNEGCSAGAACDLAQDEVFRCFEPPNDAALCATCDGANGPFCVGTSTCIFGGSLDNKCARYCCNDGDCGSGTCVTDDGQGGPLIPGTGVGVCVNGDATAPSCDAPGVAPSNGACLTL